MREYRFDSQKRKSKRERREETQKERQRWRMAGYEGMLIKE